MSVDPAPSTPVAPATPYEQVNPGDLISASLFNRVQVDIKDDIAGQIKQAIGDIKQVDTATDAQKLDGKTIDDLKKELLDDILKKLPGLIGNYRQIFRRLEVCKEYVVKHNLKAMPLVDVYQLDYFQVICATGETPGDRNEEWVNFYLYNDNERTIRTQTATGGTTQVAVDIELRDATPFRVLFKDMLALYDINPPETTTLDELENDFWTAFFDPNGLNDRFDTDQYCHSPWFEKCCGEKRSLADLKAHGDWDHIWLKWHARKTINFPMTEASVKAGSAAPEAADTGAEAAAGGIRPPPAGTPAKCPNPGPAPTNIQVVHFDWNQLGITLLQNPVYLPSADPNAPSGTQAGKPVLNGQPNKDELKVMLLLKA
jgi:hypothetical protein